MDNIIARLMETDSDALLVIKTVLEARVNSASIKLSGLELRSEVCKGYALMAALADAILAERENTPTLVMPIMKASFSSGLTHE